MLYTMVDLAKTMEALVVKVDFDAMEIQTGSCMKLHVFKCGMKRHA